MEIYQTSGLKIVEEVTSDEFDKEIEEVKKKNEGKIRNKNIAKGDVKAVEIQKEDAITESETTKVMKGGKAYYKDDEGNMTPVNSKSGNIIKGLVKSKTMRSYMPKSTAPKKDIEPLTAEQGKRKLEIMDNLHKDIDKFKEKYGDRAHIVIHGIADKMASKPVSEGIDENILTIVERELTSNEMEEREDTVKGMKKNSSYFKDKYGSKWKEVMYATATKMAKK
jgi:hypothetical protein